MVPAQGSEERPVTIHYDETILLIVLQQITQRCSVKLVVTHV